jgi:hypothetical protein
MSPPIQHIFSFLLRKGQQRHPFLRGTFFNYSKILFRKKDTADGPTHHPDASGWWDAPLFLLCIYNLKKRNYF